MRVMVLFMAAAMFAATAGCTLYPGPDIGSIQRVDVRMAQDDLKRLNESLASDEYTPCIYEDDRIRVNAFIKVRGGISLYYRKKSFTVLIEVGERTVRYAFDAAFKDPSHIRNRLSMFAYREAGLPAPRVEGTAFFINGVYAGYYTRLEMYSEPVLNAHYEDRCELYKVHVGRLGYDAPLRGASEKKFPENDNFAALELLFANARNMDQDTWNRWISVNGNVEDLARYLVVHDYLAVGDTALKNFYVCACDRYVILPWDNDQSFGRNYAGGTIDYADYEIGGDNLLTRKLLGPGSPVRARYNELMEELFLSDDQLVDTLTQKIDEWYGEMDRAVYHEPIRFRPYEDFLAEKSYLNTFLGVRKTQIPSPPFP